MSAEDRYIVPSEEQLNQMGLSSERFHADMVYVLEAFEVQLRPTYDLLNMMKESSEDHQLATLKLRINHIMKVPWDQERQTAYCPCSLLASINRVLAEAFSYIFNLKGKKVKLTKSIEVSDDAGQLTEITPKNISEERAMVLLRILKAAPKKALHTEDCRKYLSEDGKILNPELARRAMKVLDDCYPTIIYEKSDGSFRVRIHE